MDKGTIDAVLSSGLDPARRICQEAMRVLEPGGTFLVVSNTPGKKLLSTLLSMCGPGSACDSPLAVPAVGGAGPCVYAYIIRKNSPGNGKGEGVVEGAAFTPERADSAQQPEKPNESDATSVEAFTTEGARGATVGDAAPRSDSHVSDLKPPVEQRTHATVDVGFDGRTRGGVMGEAPPSDGRSGHALKESTPAEILKQNPEYMKKADDMKKRGLAELERIRNLATKTATVARMREEERQAMKALDAYRSIMSLPWGARECFSEDGSYATYELKFDTELSPSKLSVEIGATHVKACYRWQPNNLEVLLDRELFDAVTAAESTWCIEDKTVLSFK